jgi:hypothetical protein
MIPPSLRIAFVTAWLGLLPQLALAQRLNTKVVEYCEAHIGQKVGSGQCSSLAYYALEAAGAKDLNDFDNNPGEGDYVWGKHVYTVTARDGKAVEEAVGHFKIRPGDVVQFRNTTFKGQEDGKPYTWEYEHHTAVVVKMNHRTGAMAILEQNVNGKQVVQRGTLFLKDLRSGWLRVYRPVRKRK